MMTPAPDGFAPIVPDLAAEIRYTRLAEETTGYTRRVMLRLSEEAHTQTHPATTTDNTTTDKVIELHLVPIRPGSSPGVCRTYA
jgi:hypothetical protein